MLIVGNQPKRPIAQRCAERNVKVFITFSVLGRQLRYTEELLTIVTATMNI